MEKCFRGEDWDECKEKALLRDGYTCAYPGCQEKEKLAVHHIIPYKRFKCNDLFNLITLCPRHHKKEDNHFVQFKQVSMTLRRIQRDWKINLEVKYG